MVLCQSIELSGIVSIVRSSLPKVWVRDREWRGASNAEVMERDMKRLGTMRFACGIGAALLAGAAAAAAPFQAPSPTTATVKTSSEEVLLDVVVRDKKGHAVNDLKPGDFEILDNGEPKKINSFRLVRGAEAIGAGGARTSLDPLRQIRLVTLIFHCSSNDARQLARSGALDLVKSELPQNAYMAVMTIDYKIEVLQPFTNDPQLLKTAIDRATRSQATDFSKATDAVRADLEQMLGPNSSGAQSTQERIDNQSAKLAAQGRNASPTDLANVAMAQMVLQMIQTEKSNAEAQEGQTEIWALLDAVKEQYRLPGRKTVLYFTEGGFSIPHGMEQPFDDVISIANRSNVSFYPVDARGLDTTGANQSSVDMLQRAAQSSRDQQANGGSQAVRPDEAQLFDTGVRSTRANTQSTLADLASSTGGVLIANTNDLRNPLRKLAEDIETYYEISYSPGISNYDGSFHHVAVKTTLADLHVQSRSGYFALPPALAAGGGVLHAYEVPLLAALGSSEPPQTFAFHAEGLHYRGSHHQPVCDLVIDVPLGNLTFQKEGDQFAGRLSYVALVKGAQGQVVQKFENEVPLTVPGSKIEALKASRFIYTEHFDLPPGHYTLESAVLDGVGNRISARRSSLIMPPPGALGMSSVCIVRSAKDKDASTDSSDPMLAGTRVISPTLSPVISKAADSALSFYVVIYPDPSVTSPAHLSMEFSRNGEVLGSGSPQLGPVDKEGRIQYVATAPLAQIQPGDISIRFIVTQGPETAEEGVSFTLQ